MSLHESKIPFVSLSNLSVLNFLFFCSCIRDQSLGSRPISLGLGLGVRVAFKQIVRGSIQSRPMAVTTGLASISCRGH